MAMIYVVGVSVWLAWFGKGFFEITVAGGGIRASDPEVIGDIGQDLAELSSLIATVSGETEIGLENLNQRLQMIERK